MGNSSSVPQGPYAYIELTALQQPLVAIDLRFVQSAEVTRVKFKEIVDSSKNLKYKDMVTRKALFRTGPDGKLKTLSDGNRYPLVNVVTKSNTPSIYYVYRPGTPPQDQTEDSALLQVYVKLGKITKTAYLDTTLHVDITDLTTGERCTISMEGEWRSRNTVFWLEQGHDRPRVALGKVYRPKRAEFSHEWFTLEIAPNVDTALVVLVCAILDDDLAHTRHFSYSLF